MKTFSPVNKNAAFSFCLEISFSNRTSKKKRPKKKRINFVEENRKNVIVSFDFDDKIY